MKQILQRLSSPLARITLSLLLVMVVGVGNVWGEDSVTQTYTLSANDNGKDVTTGDVKWSIGTSAIEAGTSSSKLSGTITVTLPSGAELSSVEITKASNWGSGATVVFASGSTTLNTFSDSGSFNLSSNKTDLVYTFTKSGTSNKNAWVKTISVTYTGGETKTATTTTFGDDVDDQTFNVTKSDRGFTKLATVNPSEAGSVKYSSSNTKVATVNESTGEVSFVGLGSADIAAKFESTSTYKESSAKYTVIVSPSGTVATYTIDSKTSVSTTGTVPTGSTATYAQTYSTSTQMTKDNSTTLTLSGYKGCTIKGIVLSMHSNTSAGSGQFSAKCGESTIVEQETAANFNLWYNNTTYGTDWRDIMIDTKDYNVTTDDNIVVYIKADVNSLFIQSYKVYYEAKTAAPTFTPDDGTEFRNSQEITIAAASGASIYYTTDGSAPTTSSTQYTAPFSITATTTVKAIAVESGKKASDVASATYTLCEGKLNPNLKFAQDSYSCTWGENLTISATSNSTAQVTISMKEKTSDAYYMAGIFYAKTSGVFHLVATVVETDDYNADSKEVEITVNKKSPSLAWSKSSYSPYFASASKDYPTLSTNKDFSGTITYSSSNQEIATISSDGTITLVNSGESTTIRAAYNDEEDDLWATEYVEYTLTPKRYTLNASFAETSVDGKVGKTITAPQLTANTTATPEYSTTAESTVATVDSETGVVTLNGEGSATITATFAQNTGYTGGTCSYTINITKNELTLSFATPENAVLGEEYVEPKLTLSDNEYDGTIQYAVSENSIGVSIDQNTGKITLGDKPGHVTVTATAPETTKFEGDTKSYKLVIVDPNATQSVFDFTDPESLGLTDDDFETSGTSKKYDIGDKTFDISPITMSTTNGGTTATRLWKSSTGCDLRLYYSATNTATITFSAAKDYVIKSVAVVGTNGGLTTESGWSSEENTWTGTAKSVTLTTTKNSTITSATITYELLADPELAFAEEEYYVVSKDGILDVKATTTSSATITYKVLDENYVEVSSEDAEYEDGGLYIYNENPNTYILQALVDETLAYKAATTSCKVVATTTGTISIGTTEGWGTYYTDKPFLMPEGVRGFFVCSDVNDEKVQFQQEYAPGDKVPANTPLLIKGEKKEYTFFNLLETLETNEHTNYLKGNLTKGTVTPETGHKLYKMTYKNGENLGFYYGAADGGAFTLSANRAYLDLTDQQAARYTGFIFDESDTATGIEEICELESDTNKRMFNLAGQRVNASCKGMIIVGGKKCVRK